MKVVRTKYRTSAVISPLCANDLSEISESILQFRPPVEPACPMLPSLRNARMYTSWHLQPTSIAFLRSSNPPSIRNSTECVEDIYTLTDRLNVWMNTKALNVGHRGLSVIHYCPYLVIHFNWEMSDTRYAQASHISSSSVHSACQRVFSLCWENL